MRRWVGFGEILLSYPADVRGMESTMTIDGTTTGDLSV